MRLRYLAAAPLLAAAMFGTTAAAWPSATADPPQALPALTASALSARYAADAEAIAAAGTRPPATATASWPARWPHCTPSRCCSSIRPGRAWPRW